MRIRTISFRGFGPYLDQQYIDFDQLGASGLYLISGPTGAGKSTIIDAVCYALYGELAGNDADPSRMRSHFATSSDPTEVDVTFETASGVFRVIRTPEYMRAAKTGKARDVPEKATCNLFRIRADGSEQTIATQVASAKEELTRIVGLTKAQFVQTVVLPQGQFAAFLNSSTKEREAILKSIFKTGLYELVTNILKEDAKEAHAQMGEVTKRIVDLAKDVGQKAELPDDQIESLIQLAAARLDDELTAQLGSCTPKFEGDVTDAQTRLEEAEGLAKAADAGRELARKEHDSQTRFVKAEQRLKTAEQGTSQARSALEPYIELASSMDISFDSFKDAASLRDHVSNASEYLGRLDSVNDDEREVLAWPSEKRQLEQEIGERQSELLRAEDRLRALPENIRRLESTIAAAPALDEADEVTSRQKALDDLARKYGEIDAEAARVPYREEQVDEALKRSRAADSNYARVADAYRAGISGELAQELKAGAPCSVCGSLEHPHPASRNDDAATAEDVDESMNAAQQAKTHLDRTREDLEQARNRIDELTASLTMSREELESAQNDADKSRKDLQQRQDEAAKAYEALGGLRDEQEKGDQSLSTMRDELRDLKGALTKADERITRLRKRVKEARGNDASVAERIQRVRKLKNALDNLASKLDDEGREQATFEQAGEEFRKFPLRDHFADRQHAEIQWEEANKVRDQAKRAHDTAQQEVFWVRDRIQKAKDLCADRAKLVASSAELLELSELFGQGRGTDSGLHIYVLRALFASVMESANRRFESLLNGRYRFVPTPDSEGDGRTVQGLGVLVEDRLSNRMRPAASLSGGEAFCASLALALGLSDVVRMTAGGVEINSLFVDEGFGSLDSDQLDEVMLMLGRLSKGGRHVGVVSHVESMKETINDRIEISAVDKDRPTSMRVSWMG